MYVYSNTVTGLYVCFQDSSQVVISLNLLGTVLVVVHNCTCHRMLLLFLGSVVMFVCITYYFYVYVDFFILDQSDSKLKFSPRQNIFNCSIRNGISFA